jgi:L-asparagine transporter-like permease
VYQLTQEVTSVPNIGMYEYLYGIPLTRTNRTNLFRHNPGAFLNGFKGFCSVFVTASFSFSGTELTGLAAAEAENPRKEIPKATKQVVWRICIFYIVNLFLIGLIVPANSPQLTDSGAESRHSPFVIAIQLAGIKALPSIFNAIILISVMSVANSCTFGSTRTFQALAQHGKPLDVQPKFTSDYCVQVWAQKFSPTSIRRAVPLLSLYFNFSSDVWRSLTWISLEVVTSSPGFYPCPVSLRSSFSAVSL